MDNLAYIEEPKRDDHQMETFEDFIIGLFVVVFDTKKGNLIEWQIPDEVDLTGVEFKALVSGSHTVEQDFVYFRHQSYYGLSCFALKSVDSVAERGARMKSVGIVCAKYTSLHEHQEFLEAQVHQHLDTPGNYKAMTQYYIKYRHCPLQNNTFLGTPRRSTQSLRADDLNVMKISHPIGCFAQFIRFFGENVFALWKFLLLQKRILFFAPPPVGVQCYRVYCTGLLGSNVVGLLHPCLTHLLFYVSVCSLAPLNHLDAYVACTTEKIFATKRGAYDLFVNDKKLECSNAKFNKIKSINSADRARFKRLLRYSKEQLCANEDITDDEKIYTRFFIEQNNRLFRCLVEISKREDNRLTSHHIREIGLDPFGDETFLRELIDLYNLNVDYKGGSCCG